MKSAVYIGAGLDVRPIRALKDTNKFIFIDSLPNTQQPTFNHNAYQYEPRFISDFCDKMSYMDFDFETSSSSSSCCFWSNFKKEKQQQIIEFNNTENRIVQYYFNTEFPLSKSNNTLINAISECDTLIIGGFDPHESIIDMMKKPVHVVCFENTYYGNNGYDDINSVISRLHKNINNTDISHITYYKKEYIATECATMKDVIALCN